MAYIIPVSTALASGNVVNLAADDDLFVAQGVILSSQFASPATVNGSSSSGHDVIVAGTVASGINWAIGLGNGTGVNSVTIESTGDVRALSPSTAYALVLNSATTTVWNAGNIYGRDGAITTSSTGGVSTITNLGTITGKDFSAVSAGMNGGTSTLINSGTITAATNAYQDQFQSVDVIQNSGSMSGNISFEQFNDLYNGANGHLFGKLFGGDGNDTATGGVDNDWFEGGNGNDSLTGNAGADQLFGQNDLDFLSGGLGNDRLFGGDGNDTLNGGLGKDIMAGDAGNDIFVFNAKLSATTNVDVINGFSHVNDTIRLENAFFKGLAVGTLSAAAFRIGTKALDASDHIIYDKVSGNLWYDPDGSGPAAQILFAKLFGSPDDVARNDFVVI